MDRNAEGRRAGRNRTARTTHQRVMHDAGVPQDIMMSLTTEYQRTTAPESAASSLQDELLHLV
jgi:hypothetical protein